MKVDLGCREAFGFPGSHRLNTAQRWAGDAFACHQQRIAVTGPSAFGFLEEVLFGLLPSDGGVMRSRVGARPRRCVDRRYYGEGK